jgi:hypothetical protein
MFARKRTAVRGDRRRLALETLEPRALLTASPMDAGELQFSGHGGLCQCPVCTGVGLSHIPAVQQTATPAASNPLSSLPALASNPGAAAKLYLDFNGHFQASWGSFSNATTPVFDQDGDAATFSDAELTTIQQVWARVAEDYAPFNVDVTTIDPGNLANRVVAHIAIGGNWSDWYGHAAGGVAYIGGFYNAAPNVGYVFEAALGNGNARYVAEAASHEAGHLFGLLHQARWNGSTLVEPYHSGNANWAPIMGVGYYATRTTWHNGATSASPNALQSDMAIIAGASNGFGFRPDDFGNGVHTASSLPLSGSTAVVSGRIGHNGDQDMFRFWTSGGNVSFNLYVSQFGANLDSVLQIWNSSHQLIATASPTTSLGASLVRSLAQGTYFVSVRATGGYGNVGRYTLTGTVPQPTPPEIGLSLDGSNLNTGDAIDFGATTLGAPVTRTFTVHNTGIGNLSLTPLTAADLPPGFEIVSNLGSTLLAPGATTTFEIRLAAADAGAFSGALRLKSNDADENPFVLNLSGQTAGAEITVHAGTLNVTSGQTVGFGPTFPGTPVERTFTVSNTGTNTLTLAPIDADGLPAGFTLVANLGGTALLAGESTTFIVRLDAAAAGTYSGTLALVSDDANESPFAITLTGAVTPPLQIIDNGAAGNTRVGSWIRTTNKGFELDIHSTARGNGTRTSNWIFSNLASGQYRLWGSWTGGSSNASDAPFRIYSGQGTVPIVRVSQRTASSGLLANGGRWKFLGTVNVTKGWVKVSLTNAANGVVVADAVRLVAVPASLAAADKAGSTPSTRPPTVPFLAKMLASSHSTSDDGPPPADARHQAFQQTSAVVNVQQKLDDTIDLLAQPDELPEYSAVVDQLLDDALPA